MVAIQTSLEGNIGMVPRACSDTAASEYCVRAGLYSMATPTL